MSIELTASEKIARIRSDFRMGVAVGFLSGQEKWLVASAEAITISRFNGMRQLGSIELTITDWRAQTLSTWATDGDIARLAVPDDKGLEWIQSVCDPSERFQYATQRTFYSYIWWKNLTFLALHWQFAEMAHLIPSVIAINVTNQDIIGDLILLI